ncbi:MAG: hypothetical protein NTZ49_01935 [Candidatus Parcubacteria bacterium]|nr:hypothetical protein [Candidatus Parcubacteria bacterium]
MKKFFYGIVILMIIGFVFPALADSNVPSRESNTPMAFPTKPTVTWGANNYLNVALPENPSVPLVFGYNGNGFPGGTNWQITEKQNSPSEPLLFTVEVQLPGSAYTGLTPSMLINTSKANEGERSGINPWSSAAGLPDKAQCRVKDGRFQCRSGWAGQWEDVKMPNANSEDIVIYERDVPDPEHPSRVGGKLWVIYNTKTGETIVIYPNITGLYRTIRYGFAATGGTILLCFVAFFVI